MKKILSRATLLVALFFALSCDESDPVVPERALVSSNKTLTRQSNELQTFLSMGSLDIDIDELKYDVDIYTIEYETTFRGEQIVASALVMLPTEAPAADMISFQHGTIAAHDQAPTALHVSSTELILYTALASPGFIAVVPDFIGFGASKEFLHPYYVEEPTATSVVDAMRAARDLASDKGVAFSGKVFLAGYSEGGYATMAAHKSLEENPVDGLDLVASFPASGGYDIKNMQEYFFGLTTYSQPFYIAFVAQAYTTTFNWSQPLSDLFKEPYADRIPALVNGTKDSDEINQQLTNTIPDLISEDLLANIDSDNKYKYIVDAFNDNALTDWTPTRKMYMYHGDADATVPYSNSVSTYNKLIANGASTSTVTLTALPGSDHYSGIFPYLEQFVPIMLDLK